MLCGKRCLIMANEEKKDFNAMLHDSKDMSKFQTIADEKSIGKDGGERMYFAKQSGADFTEPIRRESLVPLPQGQAFRERTTRRLTGGR